MENITNVFITLVLALIGFLAVTFGFDYIPHVRSFEQTFVAANMFVLISILLGSSLYFTITKFRDARA